MLRFRMRGSAGAIYEVTALRSGAAVVMTCTCDAAINGIHCHHRLELCRGDVTALESGSVEDLAALKGVLAGTALLAAVGAFDHAEEAQRAAKADRDRRVKAVDRLLKGG